MNSLECRNRRGVVSSCVGMTALALALHAGATVSAQTCAVNFDLSCPTAVSDECGAFFDGGGGCIFAGLPFCYDTGIRSYQVTAAVPLTITIPGGISALDVFFAHQGGASGEMRFFDAEVGGTEVGTPLVTNGDCLIAMPARQTVSFPAPVRRIEVTSTVGTVWIDTFIVTAGPACGGVNDCSGNGVCVAPDTCACSSGWTGVDCSMFACDGVNDCSGHGVCVGSNSCQCNEGFGGPACSVAIPAVSEWGLIVLGLLIIGAGTLVARRGVGVWGRG